MILVKEVKERQNIMTTTIRESKYIKSDVRKNNNKFWYITELADASIQTQYGRVGDKGQSRLKSFGNQELASKFYDKKCREKQKSGRNGEIAYRPLNVISGTSGVINSSTGNIDKSRLKEIAKKQIKTNGDPIATKLIEYLTKVNAHNISVATGGQITFNDTTGLFSTPLGIITQSNIDEANNLLTQVGDMVAKQTYNNQMIEKTNDYLMLVPQDIGRRQLEVKSFWNNLQTIQNQKAIIDSLQASLVSATSNPIKTKNKTIDIPEEKVFDVQLSLIKDNNIMRRIKNKYNKTKQTMHSCHKLKVKKAYKVNITTMADAFYTNGKSIGNIMQLWHGTRASNLLSILRGGLIIPASSSSNVTGRMFGNGIYFSDQSTKALNYADGYWGGNKDNNCFMFLADVAMGKAYTPKTYNESFPKSNYNSTFAKAHKSGVYNNEMIVYNLFQANLTYLVEFAL